MATPKCVEVNPSALAVLLGRVDVL